eukprot:gene26252-biopygen15317
MNSCHEESVAIGIELESKLPIPREVRDRHIRKTNEIDIFDSSSISIAKMGCYGGIDVNKSSVVPKN